MDNKELHETIKTDVDNIENRVNGNQQDDNTHIGKQQEVLLSTFRPIGLGEGLCYTLNCVLPKYIS